MCKQIREKSAATEGTGADHGLFQPGDGVRMGRWLRPERTLMFYDLKSGDLVMYRKKHRPLKARRPPAPSGPSLTRSTGADAGRHVQDGAGG